VKRSVVSLLVLSSLALGAGTALAQEKPQETPARSDAQRIEELEKKLDQQQKEIDELKNKKPEKAETPPPPIDEKGAVSEAQKQTFEWGFKDGFYVRGTINEASYELRPRARLQLDYRAFPHSSDNLAFPHAIPEDQFLVRRARVGFMGHFGPFDFDFEADPARSPFPLGDFWFVWHQWDEFQVRFGHFKAPFDLDGSMVTSLYIDMVERAMVIGSGNQLSPNLRIGAEVMGKIAGGLFNYFLSAVNQPDGNVVPNGDPLYSGRLETDVKGFEFGVGALGARVGLAGPNNTGKSYPGATPGQFVFFTPVAIRGWQQAFTVDAAYYFGPVWASGGYAWAQQERLRIGADGTDGDPLVTQGAWLTAGWLFWGPTTPGPHGVPFKDWDLFSMDLEKKRAARTVGMEMVVRIETMDIRDARGGRRFTSATETTVATPSTAANALNVKGNQAQAMTVGFNLYPIENVKFMADYVLLHLGDQQRAERAHSNQAQELLFRAQLEF
jgi:hypothetical protein